MNEPDDAVVGLFSGLDTGTGMSLQIIAWRYAYMTNKTKAESKRALSAFESNIILDYVHVLVFLANH